MRVSNRNRARSKRLATLYKAIDHGSFADQCLQKPKVSEQDLKRWKNDITQLSRVWSDTPGLGPVSITLEMFQNGWIQRCPGHESYTGFPVADGKTNYLEAEYYSLYNYTINYISHACMSYYLVACPLVYLTKLFQVRKRRHPASRYRPQ